MRKSLKAQIKKSKLIEDDEPEVAYVSAVEQTKKHRISSNELSIDYDEYNDFINEYSDDSLFEIHLNDNQKSSRLSKAELRQRLNKITEQKNKLISENSKKKDQIEAIVKQIEMQKKKEDDEELKAIKAEIERLTRENSKLKVKISETKKHNEEQQSLNDSMNNDFIKVITERNDGLRYEIEKWESKISSKLNESSILDKSIDSINKQITTFKDKMDIYSAEAEAFQLKQVDLLPKMCNLGNETNDEEDFDIIDKIDFEFEAIDEALNESFSLEDKSQPSPISEHKSEENCKSDNGDQGNVNDDSNEECQNIEFNIE